MTEDLDARLHALQGSEDVYAMGDQEAAAVVACWRWCATLDPSLEPDLRIGADYFPAARADLAHLLRETGRPEEAHRCGIAAGEAFCHHNLAVLLAERGDFDGAVEQFRLGAAAGDQLAADALRELEHG